MITTVDIAIIGAGMAGASLAAALAGRASVALIEAESAPGYHATGRSAAFWTESYGGPGVYPLTSASGPFLRENGFLAPRSALTLGRIGQEHQVEAFVREFANLGVSIEMLGREQVTDRVPGLRSDWTCGSLETDCSDIDVAALHQHYLSTAQQAGCMLYCGSRLKRATAEAAGWLLETEDRRQFRCAMLVNAAGAWADPVAQMANVMPLGIAPFRRTVAQLRVAPSPLETLPLVLDIAQQFYFKPESGRLWLSPHDETPSQPCDAAADELDVAKAIDRLGQVVDWQIERVEHKWAGLRSFAPDRLPVIGPDVRQPRFFWFAGQGGFGIQTAPAAADLAASILLGESAGAVDPACYLPDRFSG
jgi:D-arginine dehydrogenase